MSYDKATAEACVQLMWADWPRRRIEFDDSWRFIQPDGFLAASAAMRKLYEPAQPAPAARAGRNDDPGSETGGKSNVSGSGEIEAVLCARSARGPWPICKEPRCPYWATSKDGRCFVCQRRADLAARVERKRRAAGGEA